MKMPALIKRELEALSVPHKLVEGTKHVKIFVGNSFCGILPKCGRSNTNRAELNVRAKAAL